MGKGKLIHVMGTSSNAGKSTIAMGLCRIISDMGIRVAPFKAMNMSLNSISTPEGSEIARSQWLQARASRMAPDWRVNPILLKPEGMGKSQVIFKGRSLGSRTIDEYGKLLMNEAREVVKEALKSLLDEYEVVVAEGSGSASEINLYDRDLANTWLTNEFEGCGILVNNIENGGSFGALYGTKTLAQYPERLNYFIINNMRGRNDLLNPGIEKLSSMAGMKCLGIIPHLENNSLPGEDSLDYSRISGGRVGIIRYPYFENYSDIDPLIQIGIGKYITSAGQLDSIEALLLPGSKNVYEDILFINKTGIAEKIKEFHEKGKRIMGICGGYQMLSKTIRDPDKVQMLKNQIEGLGLLDAEFIYSKEKEVYPVKYSGNLNGTSFSGSAYFIHYGKVWKNNETSFASTDHGAEGSISTGRNIIGTNLHGILENSEIFRWLTGIKRTQSYEMSLEENIQAFSQNLSVNLKRELLMDVINET